MKHTQGLRDVILRALFIPAFVSFFGVGCGGGKLEQTRWSASQVVSQKDEISTFTPQSVSPPLPSPITYKPIREKLLNKIQSEKVLFTTQKIQNAEVRGSYVKYIESNQGETKFIASNIVEKIPLEISERVEKANLRKEFIVSHLKRTRAAVRNASKIIGPKLEVIPPTQSPKWKLRWVLDYLDQTEENFFRLELDEYGNLIREKRVGSHFETFAAEGEAIVFPKGPKMSSLTAVPLKNLAGDGNLVTPKIHVTSMAPERAFSVKNIFNFDPSDYRFDDVQAFFYVEQALDWFKRETGFELPFSLDVRVHVGGLQTPKNTAYYYHGNIRLGAGDGLVYKDIQRDPTIVIHETCHAIIEAVSGLGYEGQNGSLNEAFADFFTANLLNQPNMGEVAYIPGPYKRTLKQQYTLSDANGGLYHDSLIVSGLLWDIRSQLGTEKAFSIALKTLARLTPDSKLIDIKEAILTSAAELGQALDQPKPNTAIPSTLTLSSKNVSVPTGARNRLTLDDIQWIQNVLSSKGWN